MIPVPMFDRRIVILRKSCACDGTSSDAHPRFMPGRMVGDTVIYPVTYTPGRTCDVCGKAWEPQEGQDG